MLQEGEILSISSDINNNKLENIAVKQTAINKYSDKSKPPQAFQLDVMCNEGKWWFHTCAKSNSCYSIPASSW